MDSKTTFVRFISNDYSTDYWSDVAVEEAIELAAAMSSTEWVAITSNWQGLAPICQVRLAEVASAAACENATVSRMLVAMLSSDNPDVVEASLDSLNSICQLSSDRLEALDVSQALANVDLSGKISSIILESFKRRLNR